MCYDLFNSFDESPRERGPVFLLHSADTDRKVASGGAERLDRVDGLADLVGQYNPILGSIVEANSKTIVVPRLACIK